MAGFAMLWAGMLPDGKSVNGDRYRDPDGLTTEHHYEAETETAGDDRLLG